MFPVSMLPYDDLLIDFNRLLTDLTDLNKLYNLS